LANDEAVRSFRRLDAGTTQVVIAVEAAAAAAIGAYTSGPVTVAMKLNGCVARRATRWSE